MNMLLHGVENPDIRYRDSLAAGARRRGRRRTRWSWPTRRSPAPRLRDHRQGPASRSSRPRRPSCSSSRCSCGCSSPAAGRRSSCPTACCSAPPRRTRSCAGCWSRTRSSTPWSRCPAACSGPTPASPPRSCSSPRPTPAAPTTSGSTTSQADGWSLDDKRTPLLPEDKLGPVPRSALDDGRAREEQPARRAGALGAARRRRARAPAHRAELLRAQGRHRRAGLRPVAQPLQGSRPRGGRAPAAEGDHRRACRSWRRRSSRA